jgi:hypothetical protein
MENAEEFYSSIMDNMRSEGGKDNPDTLFIGTMLSSHSVEVDGLKLDKDDLLFNEKLLKPVLTRLSFSIQESGGIVHSHGWTDNSTYIKPLKKGDKVAVMKCENNDTYVVLCKVVSA